MLLAPGSRCRLRTSLGSRIAVTELRLTGEGVHLADLLPETAWVCDFSALELAAVELMEHLGRTAEGSDSRSGDLAIQRMLATVVRAGMAVGAVLSGPLSRRLRVGLMTVLGPAGGFLAAILLAITLLAPIPAFAFASFFLFGLGPVLWTISTTSLRQATTPPSMIGRVSSLMVVSTYGARPLGAGLGVITAATLGMSWCVAAAVVVFALQLVVVLTSALPSVRELPAPVLSRNG